MRRPGDLGQEVAVDAPAVTVPVGGPLAGEGELHLGALLGHALELLAVDHVLQRARGVQQPRRDLPRARGPVAEHRPEGNHAGAAGDHQQRPTL